MIYIDITKAKNIAHKIRREKREQEFKPFDEIIARQIPGSSQIEAEKARRQIRKKYEEIQKQIDITNDVKELEKICNQI